MNSQEVVGNKMKIDHRFWIEKTMIGSVKLASSLFSNLNSFLLPNVIGKTHVQYQHLLVNHLLSWWTTSMLLVGGWASPLKNDGVRQLGWFYIHPIFSWENMPNFHGFHQFPPDVKISNGKLHFPVLGMNWNHPIGIPMPRTRGILSSRK